MRTLHSIYLGKLVGYNYPPVNEENCLLSEYFRQCNRPLATSKYIYIYKIKGYNDELSLKQHYNCHHISVFEVYPYVVSKLEVLVPSTPAYYDERTRVVHGGTQSNVSFQVPSMSLKESDEGLSVKGSTSLSLDGRHHQSAYSYHQHVAEAARLLVTTSAGDTIDRDILLPDILLLEIYPSLKDMQPTRRYFPLQLRHHPSAEDMFNRWDSVPNTPITRSTGISIIDVPDPSSTASSRTSSSVGGFINHQLAEYLNRTTVLRLPESDNDQLPFELSFSEIWLQELHRCISMHFHDYIALPIYSKLTKENIFLDVSETLHYPDIRLSILACCNDIKVPVLFLDARSVLIQANPTNQTSLLDSVHFAGFGGCNAYYPTSFTEFKHIYDSMAQAVVVLDNLDAALYYDHHPENAQQDGGFNQENLSRQRKLFDVLESLINIVEDRSCNNSSMRNKSNSKGCFISFSKHTALLSASTKLLFTTFIKCFEPTKVSKDSKENGVMEICNSWQIKMEERLVQATLSSSVSSNPERSNLLLNESIAEAFRRQHAPSWLECFGYLNESWGSKNTQRKTVISCSKHDMIVSRRKCQPHKSIQSRYDNVNIAREKSKTSSNIVPVFWKDIGGMERVRKEIMDVLELPLKYPHLFPLGSPRRHGVLLYGPPGTGKTLIAKAVATECEMSFLSIKGPELLDSYVGESERNVREVFSKARAQAPCILFFDEIDSLAPRRAKGTDSGGGVMDRIVSQLLTEMDQLGDGSKSVDGKDLGVFVIAATNRPDLLDPALLRPGRFDRRIYLGASSSVETRVQILKAQTRKFILENTADLTRIAKLLPDKVTGADIGAVSSTAYSKALERKLKELKDKFHSSRRHKNRLSEEEDSDDEDLWAMESYMESLSNREITVAVSHEDFTYAISVLKPSVVDLSHYEALEKQFDSNK